MRFRLEPNGYLIVRCNLCDEKLTDTQEELKDKQLFRLLYNHSKKCSANLELEEEEQDG